MQTSLVLSCRQRCALQGWSSSRHSPLLKQLVGLLTACCALPRACSAGIAFAASGSLAQPSHWDNITLAVPGALHQELPCVLQGLTFEEATHHFWVLDANGLITRKRSDITSYVQPFAREDDVQHEGESLEQVVKRVSCRYGSECSEETVMLPRLLADEPPVMSLESRASQVHCHTEGPALL